MCIRNFDDRLESHPYAMVGLVLDQNARQKNYAWYEPKHKKESEVESIDPRFLVKLDDPASRIDVDLLPVKCNQKQQVGGEQKEQSDMKEMRWCSCPKPRRHHSQYAKKRNSYDHYFHAISCGYLTELIMRISLLMN